MNNLINKQTYKQINRQVNKFTNRDVHQSTIKQTSILISETNRAIEL